MTVTDERSLGRILAIAPDRSARVAAYMRATCRPQAAISAPDLLILTDLDPADASRCSLDRAHHVVEVHSG